jgi:predicted transglutaminase-like cysteine proteinase
MIIRCFFTGFFLFLLTAGFVFAASYQPWSENVFTEIKKEYGAQAEKRMRYLHDIILKNQDKSVEEKLVMVNDTMNKLPWIADEQHWKKADYWAPPMEAIATFGGDCEDIAIAKWIMLRTLGIPAEHLRLVYGHIPKRNEYHMVLAYVGRIDLPREERLDSTWILDNLDKKVKKAEDRRDLVAIYATDNQGNMVIFKGAGKDMKIAAVREKTNIRKLEDLKQKITENMIEFKKINEGRPLFPE